MMKAGKSDLFKPDRYARLFLESFLIGSDTSLNDLLSFQFKWPDPFLFPIRTHPQNPLCSGDVLSREAFGTLMVWVRLCFVLGLLAESGSCATYAHFIGPFQFADLALNKYFKAVLQETVGSVSRKDGSRYRKAPIITFL